jgi:hypothetical protein
MPPSADIACYQDRPQLGLIRSSDPGRRVAFLGPGGRLLFLAPWRQSAGPVAGAPSCGVR